MKDYLLSLLVVSMILSVVGILAPKGTGGGLAGHIRLVAALVWICVLIAPLPTVIAELRDVWSNGFIEIQTQDAPDYQIQTDQILDEASKAYFCDMLTQALEDRFSLMPGSLRCHVVWNETSDGIRPGKVTLLLSGDAVWQSPKQLEEFVTELIGCECISAIE